MLKTPTRRCKSVDSDDPFTPIADRILSVQQTPSTSKQYTCPIRVTPEPENVEPSTNSEKISPITGEWGLFGKFLKGSEFY
ncbi:unnamed protein product [Caenorhabditis angaria]|uniref:Uncharacterized protein n=1 Tax=Caenorhabditis angaria TaxID=860376 RepID=A0A9P1IHN4_9PELO|nr:unnamed protein product [Caenorhabditis angaria]